MGRARVETWRSPLTRSPRVSEGRHQGGSEAHLECHRRVPRGSRFDLHQKRLLPSTFSALTANSVHVLPLKVPAISPNWVRVKMARGGQVHSCRPTVGTTHCGRPWAASAARCIEVAGAAVTCRRCIRTSLRQASSSSGTPTCPGSSASSGSSDSSSSE